MSKPIIEVKNLSKRYHLGRIGATRFKDDLERAWARLRGTHHETSEGKSADFWALRDISFEIQPGEIVGIIGKNGAGKSTLLKILSRITEPTSGEAILRGRVASLLEVGTGFHPDLTGRENVYLNGAILGMKRAEIDSCFDDIIAFAEIREFVDTPVKRYSSGMYTRLAFAVAAHLAADILIVDEVLAVGDFAFQQKCFQKMDEVAGSGRTVLLVSHQMGMVAKLCSRAILLEKGRITAQGSAGEIVEAYCRQTDGEVIGSESKFTPDDSKSAQILSVSVTTHRDNQSVPTLRHDVPIDVSIEFDIRSELPDIILGVSVLDRHDRIVFTSSTSAGKKGAKTSCMTIPAHTLTPGRYALAVGLHIPGVETFEVLRPAATFQIVDNGSDYARYEGLDYGCVFVNCHWS